MEDFINSSPLILSLSANKDGENETDEVKFDIFLITYNPTSGDYKVRLDRSYSDTSYEPVTLLISDIEGVLSLFKITWNLHISELFENVDLEIRNSDGKTIFFIKINIDDSVVEGVTGILSDCLLTIRYSKSVGKST